jgi:hypothetical protein
VSGSLVADLGIGPEIWLFLTFLFHITLYFKFNRFWSLRNLDLILLFVLAPGLMMLVGSGGAQPWRAFVWLFVGSALWLVRCLLDLGLARRPLLEPNLTASGLACLAIGILGLLVAETISLPVDEGAARNPADPHAKPGDPAAPPVPGALIDRNAPVSKILQRAPLPGPLKRKQPHVVLRRVLASIAHVGLVVGLLVMGCRHFERPISGLAVATCYLISPYTRIALVDSGQLVAAALIVTALVFYNLPALAGVLIGLAAGWIPACMGLLPLWAGFYWRRGWWRFVTAGLLVVMVCMAVARFAPDLSTWCRHLGARTLTEAGLWPGAESPSAGSFWSRIDPSFRLPVVIVYLALVIITTIWPGGKDLGELISLSAALLVAAQFWYLDEGGTLILLYLPLLLLMMFRPNLASKRPSLRPMLARRPARVTVAD